MFRTLLSFALVVASFMIYWLLHARSPLELFLRGLLIWFVSTTAWQVATFYIGG